MIASDVSRDQPSAGRGLRPRWLVLMHHLPPKPDYLRVKIRRRLQKLGAVALKNSVYVLPYTTDTVEDFHWLRREIVDASGEATLCASAFVEGLTDLEIEELFQADRRAEYAKVEKAARAARRKPSAQEVERLRRQLRQVQARDFFDAPAGATAARAVREVEGALGRDAGPAGRRPGRRTPHPSGAVWVTRKGVQVDRIASAWLIRRFIDPAARFRFVSPEGHRPRRGELRFDMFEGEFTHEADRCTFETLCSRFALAEPALGVVGQIVHDIDCKDDKFGRPETGGIATVIRGIGLAHPSDEARIDAGRVVFDALYEQLRRSA